MLTCLMSVSWAEEADDKLIAKGKEVYARACEGCHGPKGNSRGTELILDSIRPRDFTIGIFKYRSTPTGALPTAADLEHTVAKGIRRTAMPHHSLMSSEDRRAVVAYIQKLFAQWKDEYTASAVELPPVPKYVGSASSVARGKEVFKILRCDSCHGPEGKAKGLPPDISGNPQIPFDFSGQNNSFKRGGNPDDLYRTLVTGLDGSKMSSYREILHEPDGEIIRQGDGWHLVHYLLALRNGASD
ncbi:MAG: c-type cytochrome [Candidatus Latescibacterota bacterium]